MVLSVSENPFMLASSEDLCRLFTGTSVGGATIVG